MRNLLFVTKSPTGHLSVALQSGGRRYRVWLSDEQCMALAYRLMALGSGGETHGSEPVEVLL
jgi:hypothetical protein